MEIPGWFRRALDAPYADRFVEVEGVVQAAPAPRFSRTPPEIARPPAYAGQHTDEVLGDYGFSSEEIARLREAKAIA